LVGVAAHLVAQPVLWRVVFGQRQHDALARSVETQCHSHALAGADRIVQVGDRGRSAIERHGADAPGGAGAKIWVGRDVHAGGGEQGGACGGVAPDEAGGQAAMTGLARRILGGSAILADLQGEAARGGGEREAEGGSAARGGWLQRRAGGEQRIGGLAFHAAARMAAAVHRPRS
jgi:hypothetical protein